VKRAVQGVQGLAPGVWGWVWLCLKICNAQGRTGLQLGKKRLYGQRGGVRACVVPYKHVSAFVIPQNHATAPVWLPDVPVYVILLYFNVRRCWVLLQQKLEPCLYCCSVCAEQGTAGLPVQLHYVCVPGSVPT